jgi:hypothetical protein
MEFVTSKMALADDRLLVHQFLRHFDRASFTPIGESIVVWSTSQLVHRNLRFGATGDFDATKAPTSAFVVIS